MNWSLCQYSGLTPFRTTLNTLQLLYGPIPMIVKPRNYRTSELQRETSLNTKRATTFEMPTVLRAFLLVAIYLWLIGVFMGCRSVSHITQEDSFIRELAKQGITPDIVNGFVIVGNEPPYAPRTMTILNEKESVDWIWAVFEKAKSTHHHPKENGPIGIDEDFWRVDILTKSGGGSGVVSLLILKSDTITTAKPDDSEITYFEILRAPKTLFYTCKGLYEFIRQKFQSAKLGNQ